MIKNNLNNNLFKIISIACIALTMSLMTFSFTAFAQFTIANPNPNPKPITTVNWDFKGKETPGKTIKLKFDTGETKTATVDASGKYSINFDYPRTIGEIQIETIDTDGTTSSTKYIPYNITIFATDSKGNIIGPVILSGGGQVPGETIEIKFSDGETLTALVDPKGNYSVKPLFPKEPSDATIVGNPTPIPYDGGITTITATQVTPPIPPASSTPTTPTTPTTPNPTPVTTTATTTTKATVRSGGLLPIAGLIALVSVILAVLVFNKKFKR